MAHILAVDDDRDLCELLKSALERDGHQVCLLTRGEDVTPRHCPAKTALPFAAAFGSWRTARFCFSPPAPARRM